MLHSYLGIAIRYAFWLKVKKHSMQGFETVSSVIRKPLLKESVFPSKCKLLILNDSFIFSLFHVACWCYEVGACTITAVKCDISI